jgi:hypothetical protein
MERIDRIIQSVTDTVTAWDGVDAVTSMEFLADETFDSYFFISLDIYYSQELPVFEQRRQFFPEAIAFESSRAHFKDRFLLNDIPVRLEYKKMDNYRSMIENFEQHERQYRSSGTYGLYRIEHARIHFDPEKRFEALRNLIQTPDNDYWRFLYRIFRGTSVHFLGDLSAAALKDDHYFFLFSSSGFLHNFIRLLFTVNKRYECSGRQVYKDVFTLQILPENFVGRFETFLRTDGGISLEKKAEVAELLTTSVIGMEYTLD